MHRALVHTLVLILALLIGQRASAEASLFIYPTLVMFDGNRTSAEVTIANRGDETGTFEIGFANMSMTPEGGLVTHDEEVEWSVQPFLRYSPRRATLAPGESQAVKIALRRDDTIPEGEYYSHLRVVTINSAAVDAAYGSEPQSESGVSITARSAIAIPVIWRNSRSVSQAAIESIVLDAEANVITVSIARYGLLSARGFVHVVAPDEQQGAAELVEPVPLILYPNIDRRSISIRLPDELAGQTVPRDATVVFSPGETLTASSVIYSKRNIAPEE